MFKSKTLSGAAAAQPTYDFPDTLSSSSSDSDVEVVKTTLVIDEGGDAEAKEAGEGRMRGKRNRGKNAEATPIEDDIFTAEFLSSDNGDGGGEAAADDRRMKSNKKKRNEAEGAGTNRRAKKKRKSRDTTGRDSEGEDGEEGEFVVEEIVNKRYNRKKKCYEWKVKWEGWPSEENTWEPEENLLHCKEKVEEFERYHWSLTQKQRHPAATADSVITLSDGDGDAEGGGKNEEDQEAPYSDQGSNSEEDDEGGAGTLEDNDLFDSGIPEEERVKKWDVEAITGKRFDKRQRKVVYRVKWRGYAEETWEPTQNLKSCLRMVKDYEKKMKRERCKPSTSKSFLVDAEDDYADYSDDDAKRGKPKYKEITQCWYNRDFCNSYHK